MPQTKRSSFSSGNGIDAVPQKEIHIGRTEGTLSSTPTGSGKSKNTLNKLRSKTMMNHQEVLGAAEATLMDRAGLYGSEEVLFERACTLYSILTGQSLKPYEASAFMVCLKMARMRFDRKVADNYIDTINYLSFMAQFAEVKNPVPVPVKMAEEKIPEMESLSKHVEDEIKELAKKFKPVSTGP